MACYHIVLRIIKTFKADDIDCIASTFEFLLKHFLWAFTVKSLQQHETTPEPHRYYLIYDNYVIDYDNGMLSDSVVE